jgi:hypothetical protein
MAWTTHLKRAVDVAAETSVVLVVEGKEVRLSLFCLGRGEAPVDAGVVDVDEGVCGDDEAVHEEEVRAGVGVLVTVDAGASHHDSDDGAQEMRSRCLVITR